MTTLAHLATAEPRLLAASIEGLLVLLAIYLISAAANWLKRRSAEKENQDLPLPAPPPIRRSPDPRPAPAPAATNWEEEIRRLLEGELPLPQPTAPPPVIVTPPPVLTPSRQPCTLDPRSEASDAPSRPLASLSESEHARRRAEDRIRAGEALANASQAYQKASSLHSRVAERMRHAGQHVHTTTPDAYQAKTRLHAPSPNLQLLRNPATAHQAVISALLLGPPKSLET